MSDNPASPSTTHRVMIIDDHPVVRAGIAAVLSRDPGLQVCAEAGSEAEALQIVVEPPPELAIVDLSLANTSGFLLFRRLLQRYPDLRMLVLSMHDETVYAEKVLQAGAHGYLMKGETVNTLIEAARTVLDGQLYVSNRMRSMMLAGIARGTAPETKHGPGSLSRTELIVLQLLGSGSSSHEIAERLNRSVKTIDTHRTNIRQKLGLPNGNALLHYAIQWVQQNPSPMLDP